MFHRVKSESQGDAGTNNVAASQTSESGQEQQTSAPATPPQQHASMRKPYPQPANAGYAQQQKEKSEDTKQAEETGRAETTPPTTSSYASRNAIRPGSPYATAPYATPYTPSLRSEPPEGERRLVIGRGITMSGQIESCEQLIVEGTVEAALKGASILEIAESGTFYGTVDINEATVAGRFEGELTVNGRLTIRASGTITGTVSYRELEVEAGAVIEGRMIPLASGAGESRKPLTAASAKATSSRDSSGGNKARSGGQHHGAQAQAAMEGDMFAGKAAAE